MAINTSALLSYVEEQNLPLIRKSVLGARTIKYLTLQTGVVGPTAINLLETSVEFGDGSTCGWNANGETRLSQRKIVPANLKVNMSFCDKQMLSTWAQHEVRVAAGHEQLPFEEAFVAGITEQIGEKLDVAIWQGVYINGTHYNGFLNRMLRSNCSGWLSEAQRPTRFTQWIFLSFFIKTNRSIQSPLIYTGKMPRGSKLCEVLL